MRHILFWVAGLLLAVNVKPLAYAQPLAEGDSVAISDATSLKSEPRMFGDEVAEAPEGSIGMVVGVKDNYRRVRLDSVTGWVYARRLQELGLYRKEQQRQRELDQWLERRAQERKRREEKREQQVEEQKRKRAEEQKRYLRFLRQKGYSVVLATQTFEKNSAGGINIGLGLGNISDSKTIKYVTATWRLYNPVGDPVSKGLESSRAETKLVGPLEPGETGYTEFENVWYSNVGSCAVLEKLVVEHIDGTSFTYVSDLTDIAEKARGVRLEGDCSYEAQKAR
jgi:hypothetical protein